MMGAALSRWTIESIEKCAEKVASWAPEDLNYVFFMSSGSEAEAYSTHCYSQAPRYLSFTIIETSGVVKH